MLEFHCKCSRAKECIYILAHATVVEQMLFFFLFYTLFSFSFSILFLYIISFYRTITDCSHGRDQSFYGQMEKSTRQSTRILLGLKIWKLGHSLIRCFFLLTYSLHGLHEVILLFLSVFDHYLSNACEYSTACGIMGDTYDMDCSSWPLNRLLFA